MSAFPFGKKYEPIQELMLNPEKAKSDTDKAEVSDAAEDAMV